MSAMSTACAVGPRYVRPQIPLPSGYKEQSGEWRPAQPSDGASRGKWWEIFGDSELDSLEEQVTISNQNIAQTEAQFRGARAAARGARADLFPTVGASASVARSRTSRTTSTPGETRTSYQLAGDASYEVDVWGRIRHNVAANVANAQATAADLEAVRLLMHADLAADYFQLRGLDAQIRLLSSSIAAYEKALQLTVNRHDQGVVSGIDVAQAETQLETTRAQATDLAISRAQLEHAIAILVGKAPAEVTIAAAPIEGSPPEIPLELPSELLERRPDVAAAERRVAAANEQIGVAQAAFFPSLLLNATGGWEASSLRRLLSAPSLVWSLGAALAQTVFDGGRRIAAKEQAVAAYDSGVAVYRESVLAALQEVEDDLAALRLLGEEAGEQERAVAAAERALQLAQSRYQGGITTYLEVVTAQAASLANERTAVELQSRRMTASVDLIRALGGGWTDSDLPTRGAILARRSPVSNDSKNGSN